MQPSAHHATGSPHAQPRLMCIFYFSSLGRVGDVDAYSHGALQRRRSRTHTRRRLTPHAGHAHAHAHGGTSTTEPVPNWRGLLKPQRGFPRSTPNTPRTSPSLTHRHESVLRRTCGFWSAFVGPAAPTRTLLVQPSAHHATGSPHAQPRLMCLFYFSSSRPDRWSLLALRDEPPRAGIAVLMAGG